MAATRWRAIVDNDFAGDPDGLVSLAHVLLTDDVRVELISCTPVDPGLAGLVGVDPTSTAALGGREAHALLEVLSMEGPDIVVGAEAFGSGAEPSAAAQAIVKTCMADGDVPLAILCGGPLTNIAAAIALEPRICEHATLAWIGGSGAASSGDGASPEYNRDTDAAAAAFVLASSIPVVQVPRETYERLRVSLAEVKYDLAHGSFLGAWLADRLLDVPHFVTLHGAITLGDSALAALVGLDATFGPPSSERGQTSTGERFRRTVSDIDMRLLWGDFLAKLRLHERESHHREDAR
ncbi:nucleoside hydrolase [Microbacterium sp. DT81.1]|uniref:nucleoside hydrolase n=1 Tax=Microbacterium sp. DT81.1 TaxID=3393413 RepID=UPI003CEEDFC8